MVSDFRIDFLSVGPQRTGSTWLYALLSQSGDILFPVNVKETFFFDRYYNKGLLWYSSHFNQKSEASQLIGEIGPTYFNDVSCIDRIKANNSSCKIIVHLRHPIERAYSLYLHYLSIGAVRGSFWDAISQCEHIIDAGMYSKYVPIWLDTFGSENILPIVLDDIKLNPEQVAMDVTNFLGIPAFTTSDSHRVVNSASLPKFPFFAKLLTKVSSFLRSKRLHFIVELGKKLGLRKVYTGSTSIPKLTTPELEYLTNLYESEVIFLEKWLERKFPDWYCPR